MPQPHKNPDKPRRWELHFSITPEESGKGVFIDYHFGEMNHETGKLDREPLSNWAGCDQLFVGLQQYTDTALRTCTARIEPLLKDRRKK